MIEASFFIVDLTCEAGQQITVENINSVNPTQWNSVLNTYLTGFLARENFAV